MYLPVLPFFTNIYFKVYTWYQFFYELRLFFFHCCCCSHINSHNQVRGHRTGSSHSVWSWGIPRGNNTNSPRWYTHISQLTQFMPPPETYKSVIGSQSTMCQVHAGAYVSFLTPGETNYSDCHPRKTTTYILHVVFITTHTHDRRESIGEKKQRKEKKRKRR